MNDGYRIPVMVPKLPRADDLRPYLDEIDTHRRYTNFGGLVGRFEAALEGHFNAPEGSVVTTCNATLGLAMALAEAARHGSICVLPAWTFVATARAAELAGLTLLPVDVDPDTWALEPEAVTRAIQGRENDVAAVMPVAPFGAPLDPRPWEAWRADTGIPVVIDAAAGMDTARASSIPTIVSFHATKALGVGEGGCVIAPDGDFAQRIRKRSNFGLPGPTPEAGFALNAKMSEYAAALGLASLAAWPERRSALLARARRYIEDRRLGEVGVFQAGLGTSWISATANLRLARGSASVMRDRLGAIGIETRRWWEKGVVGLAGARLKDFPVSADLNARVLGLPFYHDITEPDQDAVIDRLKAFSSAE